MRRSVGLLTTVLVATLLAVAVIAAATVTASAGTGAGAVPTKRAVSAARQIACVRQTSVGREIWLMSDTGARLLRLTRTHGDDYLQADPAWKPGGSAVAYVDYAGVTNDVGAHLWIVGADGRNARRLVPEGALGDTESVNGWYVGPAWSADGNRIAFINTMNVAQGDPARMWSCLTTYDFTTGTAMRLYRVPSNWSIRGLAWSRSGRSIEFVIDNSTLYSGRRSADAPTSYTRGGSHPSYDRTPGTRLPAAARTSDERATGLRSLLRSIDTTSGAVRTLATAPTGTVYTGLARSPDGTKVAITQMPWRGGRAALKVAPMGGAPTRTVVRASYATTRYLSPTWSPDGKRLAYGLSSPNGDSVWIVGVDGRGDHKAILRASAPAWRPR